MLRPPGDQISETGHLVSIGDAVVDVLVEADVQLLRRGLQCCEGVPRLRAVLGAGAEADLPPTNPFPGCEFCRVVV